VRTFCLCLVLMFAVPALATITKVQSNATWNTTSTTTCTVTLTNTSTNNLLAVWAAWSPSTLTASVVDTSNHTNPFPSAVGPTIQSASNTAAQIVYQNNIHGTTGTDTVTVSFSGGTATTASCVAVEYSGLDQNYPLDSVSAGYSYSPGSTLDSGTAAPANANLLVFGAGIIDSGTATAGSSFTGIQAHSVGTGSGITEQNTNPITGNNVLQRATAGLLASGSGNWLMQMAVFRDASWTVAGGWTPIRITQVLDATQFPGSDIGAQINAAYGSSSCPGTGCHIRVPARSSCYQYLTPISFAANGKPVLLEGDPNGMSCLTFTPTSGTAITADWGNNLQWAGGIRDFQLNGPGTGTAVGLSLGNSNQLTGALFQGITVIGFQNCVNVANGTNNVTFKKAIIGTASGSCSNAAFNFAALGERFRIEDSTISGAATGMLVSGNGDLYFDTSSCDATTSQCLFVGSQAGGAGSGFNVQVHLSSDHMENPGTAGNNPTAQYVKVNMSSGSARLVVTGGVWTDDCAAMPCSGTALASMFNLTGVLSLDIRGTIFGANGRTITSLINCNSTTTQVNYGGAILNTDYQAILSNCPAPTSSITNLFATNQIEEANAFQSSGTSPAQVGDLRASDTENAVCWRNHANSGDICLTKNTVDQALYNGSPIETVIAAGTTTLGSSTINAGTCATVLTTTATGALSSDKLAWAHASAPATADGLIGPPEVYLTAGNVNWKQCNGTALNETPSGLVVNWSVLRP
jgi:hypothetical protein